jgi:hypothetical protein
MTCKTEKSSISRLINDVAMFDERSRNLILEDDPETPPYYQEA